MNQVIKPTVGRIVWFWDYGCNPLDADYRPEAAIVTYVWHDRMVNLSVFGRNGEPRGVTSVDLLQPGDERSDDGGFCEGMPYQVGQAKKHGDISSTPTPSLDQGEKQAAAVQKNGAPRVGLENMKERIVREQYINPADAAHMTIAILTIENGYILVGKSAPADPANFDAAFGKQLAYEDALRQMWPLEGYLLRERFWVDAGCPR